MPEVMTDSQEIVSSRRDRRDTYELTETVAAHTWPAQVRARQGSSTEGGKWTFISRLDHGSREKGLPVFLILAPSSLSRCSPSEIV